MTYLSLFSPLPRSPILHEAYYLILEDLQGQPALGPSPPPVTLHSQKVPIHNQDVYCFEQISFPSVLFLLAMESSWEGFDSSAMNLKAVLKTPLQLLFRQPSKLDSVSVCHTERRLSPHLALCWESHNHFGGWDLSGQEWPLVQKLCKVIMQCMLQMLSHLRFLLSEKAEDSSVYLEFMGGRKLKRKIMKR